MYLAYHAFESHSVSGDGVWQSGKLYHCSIRFITAILIAVLLVYRCVACDLHSRHFAIIFGLSDGELLLLADPTRFDPWIDPTRDPTLLSLKAVFCVLQLILIVISCVLFAKAVKDNKPV